MIIIVTTSVVNLEMIAVLSVDESGIDSLLMYCDCFERIAGFI